MNKKRVPTPILPTQPLATPQQTGQPSIWDANPAKGITPGRLASILQASATGDADDYLGLAEQLEEMDPHYRAVLQTRKIALQALELMVEAVSDDKRDQAIADSVRNMLTSSAAEFLVDDLSDALGKGFAVVEMLWGDGGGLQQPVEFNWVDPRHFKFCPDDGRTLKLKQKNNEKGLDLPDYQFIVHVPRLKAGLPLRGGLARTAAWYYLFKNYALKDWVTYAEVYGMPLRLGRYNSNASEDDKSKLRQALRGLGTDAAASVPQGMDIEFLQSASKGNSDVFASLAEYCDKQVSKAVLGQTMTTDDGASLAQAKVHEEVRQDVLASDAKQLCATLRQWLIAPFVLVNFGADAPVPTVSLPVVQEEDLDKKLNAIERVVRLGGRIQATDVIDDLGFADPDKDGEILTTLEERLAAQQQQAQADPKGKKALHREQDGINDRDDIDDLVDDLTAEWEAIEVPLAERLLEKINNAKKMSDITEFLDSDEAWDAINDQPFVRALAEATFKARGLGDGRDEL